MNILGLLLILLILLISQYLHDVNQIWLHAAQFVLYHKASGGCCPPHQQQGLIIFMQVFIAQEAFDLIQITMQNSFLSATHAWICRQYLLSAC